ncbi:L-cystine transporter [Phocicoccus pinnipedialis]|uniref:L-cystine uptake protein TcyP n=1 Tax=Phocicoccus pinnipedialis TaxID=110845 RepID=A0A6V7RCE6_9BACL|nr:L-cystine transporter [Jeotgalicoccus pinnipedialis]MBP1939884.1 L-cystine uptake protein TcyP (sodium:dicarboxylate symporter family) [Jeotgalicoccus pinnipedialis]CAD2074712.1 Proton glutamate symport protein [Jeotgalicoccus pinnipedialis]
MDFTYVLLNILMFFGLLGFVFFLAKKHLKFSYRVLIALAIGLVFGAVLQLIYGMDNKILLDTVEWISVVGSGFIRLLQMIVIPLVFISILGAFAKMDIEEKFFKSGVKIISILLGTTAIAAIIGILTAVIFNLDASNINLGDAENAHGITIETRATEVADQTLPDQLVSLLPANPFLDFTGERPTSTIAVVIFAAFLGFSLIQLLKQKPEIGEKVSSGIIAVNEWIMQLVKIILRLTPYGILAIMTVTVATSDFKAAVDLGMFVVASYVALITMFIVQLIIIAITGLSPLMYIRKTLETLIFAFTSRSSAGTLPLNIQTQTTRLGVPASVANFAGSFGLSIGQNGCAGVYPAMLAMMVAPLAGVELDAKFIITLIAVTVMASLGIAGVGGGATFAAIIVLSTMNLPVVLAAVLISVEPLIDMGRTALNVSGSMVAGTVTARTNGTLDKDMYNDGSFDELTAQV